MSLFLLLAGMVAATPVTTAKAGSDWPLWQAYTLRFVSADGRVADRTAGNRTTSEGQAYALFFALVAGDQPRFERLLRWTEDNLARGDLTKSLPAWLWGRSNEGEWRVLDENPASDADLWLGYALLEGGRLWNEPRYASLGRAVLAQGVAREVVDLPGLGPTLLPAPFGFETEPGKAWRLNPSYLPPQLLRRMVSAGVAGPWADVLGSGTRVLRGASRRGFVADWVLFRADHGFEADPVTGPWGSYDAIRVYLWLGMLDRGDALRRDLIPGVGGMLDRLRDGDIPERVDLERGTGMGKAPPGFWAVMLPMVKTAGEDALAARIVRRLRAVRVDGLYGEPPAYYDQNLALFAEGFVGGRFGFRSDGSLKVEWEARCRRP